MRRLSVFAAALALTLPAFAQTSSLSGRLVDTNNVPVVGATVYCDVTLRANTDALGNFTVTGLRNQRYDVQINPRSPVLAPQEFRHQVSGASNLGTIVLQPGYTISATLVDPAGVGLLGANLSAYLPDGTKLYTPNDGTDATGFADIVVPLGPITFRAMPPVGTTFVPVMRQLDQTSTAPLALGTLTMRQGYAVTGSVVRAGATPLPIGNCEIVATDTLTGEEIFLATKRTNTLGAFNLLLPLGLYRLDFVPALGSPYAARQVYGVAVVDYGFSLGLVRLQPGVALTGTVVGPAGPIVAADLDVYDQFGHKLFTPNDNTGAGGAFSILVPAGGTYSLRVDPPLALGLTGAKTGLLTAPVATNYGTIALAAGVAITLNFTDSAGLPVEGVNLEVVDPLTGQSAVVPGNTSDAAGVMTAIAPPGVCDCYFEPRQGSAVAPFSLQSVPVVSAFTSNVTLQPKAVRTDATGLGTLATGNGGLIFVDWLFFNQTPNLQPMTVEAFVKLASGTVLPWIPPIQFDLPGLFGLSLPFWLPMPPVPAEELGFVQKFTILLRDPTTGLVLDQASVPFVPN